MSFMARLRSSLFLKVYLTLLGSLAIVALASAVFLRLGTDERDRGWGDRRDSFIAAILPAEADHSEQQMLLHRLSKAIDADISIFDPDGRPIASAGRPISPDQLERSSSWRGRQDAHILVTRLDDGRTVAARLKAPFGIGGGNPLLYLVLIAAVIGIAAYPVVRHLTRRLELLRRGVETWGDGALLSRVPVKGKDEVAAVATSFNAAAERIERLVAAHRGLLANASHELRSPLARLRMATDLYVQSPVEKTRLEILENLNELDMLVEEILLASRLDHVGKLERMEDVDLLALTSEEGARNGVEVSGEPAMMHGDPRLLTRLVRNLMQNAARHGHPPIGAEVVKGDGWVELRVRDHGQGIAPADAERVFEPFYRPAGRGEASGGWGLGLALVRQIAEHHDGTVRYEAPQGGGACFVARFPETRSGNPTDREPSEPQ
jgi:signal transduction histidine kinase